MMQDDGLISFNLTVAHLSPYFSFLCAVDDSNFLKEGYLRAAYCSFLFFYYSRKNKKRSYDGCLFVGRTSDWYDFDTSRPMGNCVYDS